MSPAAPKIRYAVVGLGHIAQVAALPAFANARRNSQLVAVLDWLSFRSRSAYWLIRKDRDDASRQDGHGA